MCFLHVGAPAWKLLLCASQCWGRSRREKSLTLSLQSDNAASRWLPLSLFPDACTFKAAFWMKYIVLFLSYFDAKCTQVSTRVSFITYIIIPFFTHLCAGRVFFSGFFWYDWLLHLCQLWLRLKAPTSCLPFILTWQEFLGRCTKHYTP